VKNIFILLIISAVICGCLSVNAQTANFDGPYKPIPQINKEFLVVAHIVQDFFGVAGIDSAAIVQQLNQLNTYFQPVNATFKLCKVDYIDNYQYNNLDDNNRIELITKYTQPNRINVYYVNLYLSSLDPMGFTDLGGISGKAKAGIVMNKSATDPNIMAHAFGHFFNLFDTNKDYVKELVDGSNCTTQGDQVCDTPADPWDNPNHLWQLDCVFVDATKKDANGDYYEPDVSNIMGFYFPCICHKFTHGQYIRMAEFYLSNPGTW
jgi:hypothetical protein